MSLHKHLINSILFEGMDVASPVPGEAPSQVSNQPVITEPTNAGQAPDLYELYPDLASVDVTSACTLADFFAGMCEQEQQAQQMQQQAQVVPSVAAMNTPQEFS